MITPNRVSWPMYAVETAAVAAFWDDLRSAMRAAGLEATPDDLDQPVDLMAHWHDPALLLSQTCGYPFVTHLQGRVRYVGTPCFRVAGCEGPRYRSAVMVRRDWRDRSLAELFGTRAAFNSRDSQSGYNALRFMVAPHAKAGRFFAGAVETGSHRASLAALRESRADVAAIDVVTLAMITATASVEVDGLHVLGYTPATMGLPLVTSLLTSAGDLKRLRQACAAACDPGRSAAGALMLDGIAFEDKSHYGQILSMQASAQKLGYADLS